MNTLQRPLISVSEAASMLSVTPVTIRRRIASGGLPAVRVGDGPRSPVRIAIADLEQLIRDYQTGGSR